MGADVNGLWDEGVERVFWNIVLPFGSDNYKLRAYLVADGAKWKSALIPLGISDYRLDQAWREFVHRSSGSSPDPHDTEEEARDSMIAFLQGCVLRGALREVHK